jgi:hypothetical protein
MNWFGGAARKRDMKHVRDMTTDELDEAGRDATVAAAKRALDKGLAIVGLDEDGNVIETRSPIKVAAPDSHKIRHPA